MLQGCMETARAHAVTRRPGQPKICCKQGGKEATRSFCLQLDKEGLKLTGASPVRAGHLGKRSKQQLPVRLLLAT